MLQLLLTDFLHEWQGLGTGHPVNMEEMVLLSLKSWNSLNTELWINHFITFYIMVSKDFFNFKSLPHCHDNNGPD